MDTLNVGYQNLFVLVALEGLLIDFHTSWRVQNLLPSNSEVTPLHKSLFLNTEVPLCDMKPYTLDLIPNGQDITVTEENKADYVNAVVEYRISKRVKEQFDAFISGFNELIPPELIKVFDERELELLIGGIAEIDVYVLPS